MGRSYLVSCACIRLLVTTALLLSAAAHSEERRRGGLSNVEQVYQANCAICHGERLQGNQPQGPALVGVELKHGASVPELASSISRGFADKGMPGWENIFSEEEVKSLALWVAENRDGLQYANFRLSSAFSVPEAPIQTEHARFTLQTVATGIDPLPYSIAVLPDNSILLSEKMRGLRLISPQGDLSPLITGTPRVYDDIKAAGPERLAFGMGWILEAAPHPDYANNGWIYLHYTNRCEDCNAVSRAIKRPVSMNALMRGRIRDGAWVDQEILWAPDESTYGPITDVAAGGRIAFDPDGYVFLSVGMKSRDGTQDLTWPGGKIHRLHDDGRIPTDNPFVDHAFALKSIWSYGHRSPQGLEFDPVTGELWGTEHGPRGGDEINLLLPGRNYGWPMFSKGQNYDGSEVAYGREASEVELAEIEQPVVDWTPSPAVSSFVIYQGEAFPAWQNQLIVGSLKAADLYRVKIVDGQAVEQEKLIEDLARIRDVEVDAAGHIYLLLEHTSGGQLVKLVP